jgi:hypothetical protein
MRRFITKLNLGAIEDHRPVKLTIQLATPVHRDLVVYAQALGRETAAGPLAPAKLARLMETDRAFGKLRASSAGAQPDCTPIAHESEQAAQGCFLALLVPGRRSSIQPHRLPKLACRTKSYPAAHAHE